MHWTDDATAMLGWVRLIAFWRGLDSVEVARLLEGVSGSLSGVVNVTAEQVCAAADYEFRSVGLSGCRLGRGASC